MSKPVRHFLAYVRPSLITEWKTLTLQSDRGHSWPIAYGFDDSNLFDNLSPGDLLWIIGSLDVPVREQSPRRMPPTLVAKLKVSQVRKCRQGPSLSFPDNYIYQYGAFADKSMSCFYPPNDMLDLLSAIRVRHLTSREERRLPISSSRSTTESRADAWRSNAAYLFQHSWEIAPGCTSAFNKLHRMIKAASVFISYKHIDHKKDDRRVLSWADPVDLAGDLMRLGFAPWLDRLALPGTRALRDATREQGVLSDLLENGLKDAKALIAIVTQRYGLPTDKENWTLDELKRVKRRVSWIRGPDRNHVGGIPLVRKVAVSRMSAAARRIAEQLTELGVQPILRDT
jgi:hypothetical protein